MGEKAGGAYVATPVGAMYAPIVETSTCHRATIKAHGMQILACMLRRPQKAHTCRRLPSERIRHPSAGSSIRSMRRMGWVPHAFLRFEALRKGFEKPLVGKMDHLRQVLGGINFCEFQVGLLEDGIKL